MTSTIALALGIKDDPSVDIEALFAEAGLLFHDTNISRIEALKRNAEIVECDRCGTTGNRPNMMRWHFENCKTVLRKCLHCDGIIPRQGIKDYLYVQKLYCNRKCYMASKKGKPFSGVKHER